MERENNNPERYYSYRMLPPKVKVEYFYTNPLLKIVDHNKGAKYHEYKGNKKNKLLNLEYCDGYTFEFKFPKTVNNFPKNLPRNIINDFDYEPLINAIPRDNGGYYQLIKPKKQPWRFENSVFKDYQKDTDEILNNCFEFDWKCSRIPILVKRDEDRKRLKEILRSVYP